MSLHLYLAFVAACIALALLPGPVVTLIIANGLRHGTRAALINAGRGGLQNEADILQCLDDGTLGAASLDVFAHEPLPAGSPFWTHPNIVLTPHNAADTDPDEISKYVARQIERFEAGGALENVVDPARGY